VSGTWETSAVASSGSTFCFTRHLALTSTSPRSTSTNDPTGRSGSSPRGAPARRPASTFGSAASSARQPRVGTASRRAGGHRGGGPGRGTRAGSRTLRAELTDPGP
jgi:hypothetical protein